MRIMGKAMANGFASVRLLAKKILESALLQAR